MKISRNDKGKKVLQEKDDQYGPWMVMQRSAHGKRMEKIGTKGTSSGEGSKKGGQNGTTVTDITVLMETRCSRMQAQSMIRRLGFHFSRVEETKGFSGGIWILWKDLDLSINYIHIEVKQSNKDSWLLTTIYTSPQEANGRVLWTELKAMAQNIKEEWLMVEDYNEIADLLEKKKEEKFKHWINSCSLIDIDYVGSKFTWKGPNGRVLTGFSEARVEVLIISNLDHHPLLIRYDPQKPDKRERLFRYEAIWKLHPKYRNLIKAKWRKYTSLASAFNSLTQDLCVWNKNVFGHVGKLKRRLINRIGGIQRAQSYEKIRI
ncbi:hypothetical protein Ahy_B10g101925 [Arachis hypogaea]|uniref:Endonuclease/exonuclease/phosphatase domain-containing protein n=1 Tax=Arachis hypogaea TaxID=3818 RepID=A0A444X0P0_ARAHY|nr:hypothetical protein Ahy_B10g101925 [Arachis hypogaea]